MLILDEFKERSISEILWSSMDDKPVTQSCPPFGKVLMDVADIKGAIFL